MAEDGVEDADAAVTVRDAGAVDETTRETGALSLAETLGRTRLADDDELADETVRDAGFSAALGSGFLPFAILCLSLPRQLETQLT